MPMKRIPDLVSNFERLEAYKISNFKESGGSKFGILKAEESTPMNTVKFASITTCSTPTSLTRLNCISDAGQDRR